MPLLQNISVPLSPLHTHTPHFPQLDPSHFEMLHSEAALLAKLLAKNANQHSAGRPHNKLQAVSGWGG